jgi:hypothetical protein
MQESASALAILLLVSIVTGCSAIPQIKVLEPASGQPHDVVFVQGDDREFAQIVWDAGSATEQTIPGGFLGGYMFSVPHDAMPGAHTVVLQKGASRSTPVTFNIPPPPGSDNVPRPRGQPYAFPAPRIDAVTIVGAAFEPSGVHTTLYVQGANLDVGATIWIKDALTAPLAEIPTASHKALRNDWYGVSHKDLDYPIYHYSSSIAIAGVHPAGQKIWIVARNLGGAESAPFEYVLPDNPDTVDSDGDNLLDTWETNGYDADKDGTVDVDLKALGADPYRRDMFLELDIMDDVKHPPDRDEQGKADNTVFDALQQMFKSAPIINLGDAPGINLVVDHSGKPCLLKPGGGEVCTFATTIFDIGGQIPTQNEQDPFVTGVVRFSRLKDHSFKNAQLGEIYHYAIWAREQVNGLSGYSDKADDFVISLDEFPPPYHTPRSKIEILAHEFGHDLSQRHGGAASEPNLKPNYLSVMSYAWALRTGVPNALRVAQATCLPFYYASVGATEVFGAVPSTVNTVVDYSEGMGKLLIRAAPAAGSSAFCGSTVDWTTMDSTFSTVEDFANWRALVFEGPEKNGGIP